MCGADACAVIGEDRDNGVGVVAAHRFAKAVIGCEQSGAFDERLGLSIEQALLPGICSLACDALVDMALDREARDNITAVVVRAEDLSSPDRTIILRVR